MGESTITAWTGEIASFTVQGSTGLTFGTFEQWEHAQFWAKVHVNKTSTGELYIMRGGDTLEIVQEGREVLELKIAGGVCFRCEVGGNEVVNMPDGKICQGCSDATGYGDAVWDYLRG